MLIRNMTLAGTLTVMLGSTTAWSQGNGNGGSLRTVPSISVPATVTLGGTVVPFKDVTFSAQIPGRVESIAGEEGDFFEKGAELITIDVDDLLAKRRAAWANYANAESALRNAGVQYSREWISPYGGETNDMMGGMSSIMRNFTNPMQSFTGGGSPGYDRHAQLYQYGTRIEQARSQIAAARASIEEIDTKIRDARSVAPFKGVITKKLVEVGDPVQPGQPMLKFADMSTLQIKVEVPARLMPGVTKGMVVQARLDVGDVEVPARVVQIFPVADPDRHTVTVKLELPQGAPGGAGMYAEVMIHDINAKVRELPVVPKEALVWRGSLPAVFVVTDDGNLKMRTLRTGSQSGDGMISVITGVKEGDRILKNPTASTKSGPMG